MGGKKCHFEELINKISKRVMIWHNKLLIYGGRSVLINNVLQSLPIYLMSTINPPKGVIDQMHKIMAKFFWIKLGGIRGKYWVAWEDLCRPNKEGGLGFRSLHTVADSSIAKLW